MSYSVFFTGTPETVVKKLEKHATILTGQSKIEYTAVLPHLVELTKMNIGVENQQIIVVAHGSGELREEGKTRTCSVSIKLHDPLI